MSATKKHRCSRDSYLEWGCFLLNRRTSGRGPSEQTPRSKGALEIWGDSCPGSIYEHASQEVVRTPARDQVPGSMGWSLFLAFNKQGSGLTGLLGNGKRFGLYLRERARLCRVLSMIGIHFKL